MPMRLLPTEPPYRPWRPEPVETFAARLMSAAGPVSARPRIVAVDGRGGGGKSTLAGQLHAAVPASAVVHTDDIAWHHSFFDWADILAAHVLEPVRRGEPVSYRPPGWVARGRPGAVEVPAGLDLVVVEGVGASRRELGPLIDVSVWVQSDVEEAECRAIERDLAIGDHADRESAMRFWHEWMREEHPFLEDQRPWERAWAVVAGTRREPHDPRHIVVGTSQPHARGWRDLPTPEEG